MPAAGWKGSVKFGPLVQFPVKAHAVDREVKFAFNTHHALDGGRLRATPARCEICDKPVPKEEVVRGYKGVHGVDEEYLDSLELQHSGVMELDGLVPASQIEPRWYRRTYDVIADSGGEHTYALFLRLLEDLNRVAIGKIVTGGQEHIVAVAPRDGALAMYMLWWPEELKSDANAKAAIAGQEVSDAELVLGRKLAELMMTDFDPSKYRNEYAVAVGEYLESFVAGKEPVKLETRPVVASPALSLEDALTASLAAMGGGDLTAKKGKAKVA